MNRKRARRFPDNENEDRLFSNKQFIHDFLRYVKRIDVLLSRIEINEFIKLYGAKFLNGTEGYIYTKRSEFNAQTDRCINIREYIEKKSMKKKHYKIDGYEAWTESKDNKTIVISEDAAHELVGDILSEALIHPKAQQVLIIKKYLDDNFTKNYTDDIDDNGYPCKKLSIVMLNQKGTGERQAMKTMKIDSSRNELLDLLHDKFGSFMKDKDDRDLYFRQILNDWGDGKIDRVGTLSVNYIDNKKKDKKKVNEYFNKDLSKAVSRLKHNKYRVDTGNEYVGDKFVDDPYGEDKREILHNEWMIHFSDMTTNREIAHNGFKIGNDPNKKASAVTYEKCKYEGDDNYNYAYLAKDVLSDLDIKNDTDLSDYQVSFKHHLISERQDGFVMFKANGYRFLHITDYENQVIFNTVQKNTIVQIQYLDDNYCVVNKNDAQFANVSDKYKKTSKGYDVNGSFTNPKNTFDNIIYFNEKIENVIEWVMTNYEQYRKKIGN